MKLSIAIPSFGENPLLENTLVSVLENRPTSSEVVVLHCSTYDDPYGLSDEVRFVSLRNRGATASNLVRTAIETCTGEVINVVTAGVEVATSWWTVPLSRFESETSLGALAPALCELGKDVPISTGLRYRRTGNWHHVIDQDTTARAVISPSSCMAFYRRSAVEVVGGWNEFLTPDSAAIDLSLRMQRAGFSTKSETKSRGQVSLSLLNTTPTFTFHRDVERVFWLNRTGGGARSLLAHPFGVFSSCLSELRMPQFLMACMGRAVGMGESWFGRRSLRQAPYACREEPTICRFEGPSTQSSQDGRYSVRRTG